MGKLMETFSAQMMQKIKQNVKLLGAVEFRVAAVRFQLSYVID